MSEITQEYCMDPELVKLQIAIATLTERVGTMAKIIESQGKIIEELVALANKGKGSAWVLIGLGSIAGAAITNLKSIFPFLVR